MICVLSCESTGTHFTQHIVETLLPVKLPWGAKGHEGFVQHVYPEGFNATADQLIAEAKWANAKIIVPMRHPVSAIITNYEQTRVTNRFANPFRNHALSFGRVASWDDCFFLQVENPDFEGLKSFLGVKYGKTLPTGPVNASPTRHHSGLRDLLRAKQWTELDERLDGAIDILRRYDGFFRWFGYEL